MARLKKVDVRGGVYNSSGGYKGVRRMGSKYGWEYLDGRTTQKKGGFDSPEEAAYNYDEFLIAYVGPNADTNQALGLLKLKVVLEIRDKLRKSDKPMTKVDGRKGKAIGVSGFKGVSKNGSKVKPWKSQTYVNNKYIQIGTFTTAQEAARAYDAFVLSHGGNDAVTNISLGLLPPVGEKSNVVPIKPVQEPEAMTPERQKETVFIPPHLRTPESEREAQIEAARAMRDEEDEEDHNASTVLETSPPESIIQSVMEEPRAALIPEKPLSSEVELLPPVSALNQTATAPNSELIVLSEADKLRQKAQEYLRQAAEVEAGNIKAQAAARLDTLSATVSKIQGVMMNLIDCCAEIETEIQSLRELLK